MALIDDLPPFYRNDPYAVGIQAALDSQVEAARVARDDALAQLSVDTATWGLAYWESTLGLSPDAALTLAERRVRVKGRLRTRGCTTIDVIRGIAEAFSGGPAEVREHPGEYWFDIAFEAGEPADMPGFLAALEAVKPAHLAYGEPPPWVPFFYGMQIFGYGFFGEE